MFQIITRRFGWPLPHTGLVPMADNYNHSNVEIVQEVIHKQKQLEASEAYFTKNKFMNDYSAFFQDELRDLNEKDP